MVKKDFIRFLKEENAYIAYLRHTKESLLTDNFPGRPKDILTVNSFIEYIINTALSNSLSMLLTHAFSWCGTLEGEAFWRNIAYKWLKTYIDYDSKKSSNITSS